MSRRRPTGHRPLKRRPNPGAELVRAEAEEYRNALFSPRAFDVLRDGHKRLFPFPGAQFVVGNPRELRIEALIIGTRATEQTLHAHWRSAWALSGEWFGEGYEEAILAVADEIARRQLSMDTTASLFDLTDEIVWQVLRLSA